MATHRGGELRYLAKEFGDGYRRPMRHSDIYEALGLDPKKHLPRNGVPPTDVGGVTVYVLAADDPRRRRDFRSRRTGQPAFNMKGKRTYAICPDCGTHVEAGHIGQHTVGRKCREAREARNPLNGETDPDRDAVGRMMGGNT